MTTLTSADINELLQVGPIENRPFRRIQQSVNGEYIITDNYEIESLVIKHHTSVYSEIKFEGVIFLGEVELKRILPGEQYTFVNCTFREKVNFYDFGISTKIEGCNVFHGPTFFKFSVLKPTHFHISQIELKDDLIIHSNEINSLSIDGVNSKTKLKVGNIFVVARLNDLYIENSNLNSISIGNFLGKEQRASSIDNYANFSLCYVNELILNDTKIGNILRIKNCQFGKVKISNLETESNRIEIREKSQIGDLSIELGNTKNFSIVGKCTIQNIILSEIIKSEQTVRIEDCNIQSKLEFRELNNKGAMILSQLVFLKDATLNINRTDLGETHFFDCDFKSGRLEFRNSKITDVFLVNSEFPETVLNDNKKDYKQSQLAFGQLHTASKKQGDTIGELQYQALEIQAHYELTKWSFKNLLKKFNLWLNKWSNNFGRYWGRGILFTFFVGVLFFYLVVITSDEYAFGRGWYIGEFSSAFVKFMNPIRFFDLDTLFESTNVSVPKIRQLEIRESL